MNQYVLVSQDTLNEILENQKKMMEFLNSFRFQELSKIPNQKKYIPESEAKQLLRKGATWFWQKRTQGELAYSKVGNRIFYLREDIDKLFDENRQETF